MAGLSNEFLADLSRILRRYGPEPWHQLADAFADPRAREKVLHLLNELITIADRKHEPAIPRERRELRSNSDLAAELIEQLRVQEPSKADRLRKFLEDYNARRILSNRRDVTTFLETLGVTPPQRHTRDRLVRLVVSALAGLPMHQLEDLLGRAESLGKRSYSELFNAITRSRRPSP
jgi:hypothetical protein